MNVGIYVRVSTEDQNLNNQVNQLRDYCSRLNYTIYKVYADKISGSIESRPAFNTLMEDSRKKLFDAVLTWKLDRLGRSVKHLISIVEEWKSKGIDIICYNQNIDTTTPNGKLMFHIIGAFAEFEKDMISERTKAGLDRARKEGKTLGRPRVSKYHINKVLEIYKETDSINRTSKEVNISYGSCWKIIKENIKTHSA
jgi:DNA invertase Pin-like site-specific DNA recombinase